MHLQPSKVTDYSLDSVLDYLFAFLFKAACIFYSYSGVV